MSPMPVTYAASFCPWSRPCWDRGCRVTATLGQRLQGHGHIATEAAVHSQLCRHH